MILSFILNEGLSRVKLSQTRYKSLGKVYRRLPPTFNSLLSKAVTTSCNQLVCASLLVDFSQILKQRLQLGISLSLVMSMSYNIPDQKGFIRGPSEFCTLYYVFFCLYWLSRQSVANVTASANGMNWKISVAKTREAIALIKT